MEIAILGNGSKIDFMGMVPISLWVVRSISAISMQGGNTEMASLRISRTAFIKGSSNTIRGMGKGCVDISMERFMRASGNRMKSKVTGHSSISSAMSTQGIGDKEKNMDMGNLLMLMGPSSRQSFRKIKLMESDP